MMGLSFANGLLLLSALAPSSLALTIARPGASVGGETVATLTSSYTTTLTNVVTSTSTVLSTAATCTPATTTPPSSAQCSNYIWWRSGTWYEEYCTDASVVGGSTATQLSAMGQYVNNINQCVQVCGMVPNVCNAINYDPALRTCYFISAAASQTLGSGAGYQAVTWHTTNPCVGTVTASLETAYSTEYITTEYTTTYTVTISSTPTPSPTTTATPSSVVLPSQSASSARVSTSAAVSMAIPSPSASSLSISPSAVSSSVRVSSASVAPSSVPSPIHSLTSSSRAVIPSASSRPSSSTALVIPSPSSAASSIAHSSSIPLHASSSTPIIRPSSSLGGISISSSSAVGSGRPTRRTTTISVTETITSSTTVCSLSAGTIQTSLATGTVASSTEQAPTSSGVDFTTSTVLTTRTATITACPSSVTNCPAQSRTTFLTTETIVVSTTVCPVTETSTPQPTGSNAGASAAHGGSPGEEQGFTTSTIFSTRTATITACPSSVTNCPARSKTTYLTTETLVVSTTICPLTLTGEATIPTGTGKDTTTTANHDSDSASEPSAQVGEGYTTSTIFGTRTSTVTACPGSVTDCPARSKTTFLTTKTIVVSTTICPVTLTGEATIPTASGKAATTVTHDSHSASGSSAQVGEGYTTSTIFSTRTATITACPSSVTNCPARAKTTYLTTETLVVSTTICPIAEATSRGSVGQFADSHPAESTATALDLSQGAVTASTTLSTRIATITACPSGQVRCDAAAQTTYLTTETLVVPVYATPTSFGTSNSVPEGADAINVLGEGTRLPVATGLSGSSAGNGNAASTVERCPDGELPCSATGTTTKTYTLVAVGTAVPVAPSAETVRPGYGMGNNQTYAAMQTASRPVGSSSAVYAASSASTATLAASMSTGTGFGSSTSSAVDALFTGGAVAGRAPSFILGAVAVFIAALIL